METIERVGRAYIPILEPARSPGIHKRWRRTILIVASIQAGQCLDPKRTEKTSTCMCFGFASGVRRVCGTISSRSKPDEERDDGVVVSLGPVSDAKSLVDEAGQQRGDRSAEGVDVGDTAYTPCL